MSRTRLFLLILAVGVVAALGWALSGNQLPPADFTFVNSTEVKSIDPALVTGSPEGNIVRALFEGLTNWDPETLEPIPGLAKSWEISDDGLVYTFHFRDDAKWTDGSPITARDMQYSLRRFLGPRTVAEYAYLAWCIKNAHHYSLGAGGIEPGDAVEVELNLPEDAVNTLRGELLRGELVSVEEEGAAKIFVVDIDGAQRRFRAVDDVDAAKGSPPTDLEWCRQVLLDFREVGVEVVDPLTLKITLENPTGYFLKLVGYYPLAPVQQECVETHGMPDWTKQENLVSNGAFKLQFRRIRDRIRLQRSDTYWDRENVKLELVDALAVEARTTALNLYMTGEVDWIITVPTPALRILLKEDPPRNDLNPAPYLGIYYYMLNTTRKPLDDLRVRRALSLALDREEITDKLLAAGEIPAFSLIPPGIKGYEAQETQGKNVELARQLLAEAGYPEGKGFPRLDILYNTDEAHQSIAELIRKQWQRELGIVIKTRNEEWASYLSSQRQMEYNISRRAWIGDYTDPNTFIDMFVTDGEQNNTGWSNPQYDQLLKDARSEVDPEKRMQIFEQAERLLMDDLPIIPIYFYVSKNMVKPYVRGFYNNLQDVHPLSAIWIDHDLKERNEFMKGRP